MKKTPGYILILTIFIIAISVAFLTTVIQRAFSYQREVQFNLNKQKARLLVLGATQIALDQVSLIMPEQPKNNTQEPKPEVTPEADRKTDKAEEKKTPESQWFRQIMPIINKWQTFEITENIAGVNGKISLYIACEQGKLDLNYLSQAIEKEAKQQAEKAKAISAEGKVEDIPAESATGPAQQEEKKSFSSSINNLLEKEIKVNIVTILKEATKSLNRDLEDPTELFRFKDFKSLKNSVFVKLPNQEKKEKEENIFFMDLFTIYSSFGKIIPWVLSKSLAKVLGLKTAEEKDININELMGKFKSNIDWSKEWDKILTPVYGKSFGSINKEIASLFSPTFDPTAFSVVAYATVGPVTQRLYAILIKDSLLQNSSSKNKIFKIAKIYWF